MMPYDDFIGDIRSVSTNEWVNRKIGRGEPLHLQSMGTSPDAEPISRAKVTKKMGGQYVPDEEHVQICLNCTRKKCTGYCREVRSYGRKRRKEGQAT